MRTLPISQKSCLLPVIHLLTTGSINWAFICSDKANETAATLADLLKIYSALSSTKSEGTNILCGSLSLQSNGFAADSVDCLMNIRHF
jgi:hypothetical protein